MNRGDYQWVKLEGDLVEEKLRMDGGVVDTNVFCYVEACFNSSPMQMRAVSCTSNGVIRCWFILRHGDASLVGYPLWSAVPMSYQQQVESEFAKFMADYVVVSVPIYDKDGRIVQ